MCQALMKAVRGGDLQQENVWLLEKMLTIFERHNDWLYGHSMLVQVSFYGFLRLMADHCGAEYVVARARTSTLTIARAPSLSFHAPFCSHQPSPLLSLSLAGFLFFEFDTQFSSPCVCMYVCAAVYIACRLPMH